MNDRIRISPVRLIDQDGEQVGVVSTNEALARARESGLDLVEISPNERPPVCKIMDYGKFKYTRKKQQRQQLKHGHESQLKEIRMRPKTDTHDREVKLKRAKEFFEKGDKVQFTMLFRGRENAHREIGLEIFERICSQFEEMAKVETPPKVMGRRMTMVLAPLKPGSK
jgi:translation initiation factor IF-3